MATMKRMRNKMVGVVARASSSPSARVAIIAESLSSRERPFIKKFQFDQNLGGACNMEAILVTAAKIRALI